MVRPGPETEALVALAPAFHAMTVVWPSVMTPGVAVIVGDGGAGGIAVTVIANGDDDAEVFSVEVATTLPVPAVVDE